MNERDIARMLAAREQGTCEVSTPAGFIDVLTPRVLYEVKAVRQWKAGLGQVLAYARSYPQHQPALYLFGTVSSKQRALITEHCKALKVRVVWHREPAPEEAVPAPPKPTVQRPDGLSLVLSVLDTSYHIRSTTTLTMTLPDQALDQTALQTCLDRVAPVFDNLLDQELTLTLRYCCQGEPTNLQWQRTAPDDVNQSPVCYRLNLSLRTERGTSMQVSLPAVKRIFPSGASLGRYDYARSTSIPELSALFQLILHPAYCWTNKLGYRATYIERAYWVSYGIRQTRKGPRMGR